MNLIPIHKIAEISNGKIAFSRHSSDRGNVSSVNYAHRDDYYIFILIEKIKKAKVKLLLDFEEYEVSENEVYCILPGQIHSHSGEISQIEASFLAVDSALVHDEYKKIFELQYLKRQKMKLNEKEMFDLRHSFSIIHRKLNTKNQPGTRHVLLDLISSYIGMIAETYQKGTRNSAGNQLSLIASRFKTLLSENYKTLKRPSQYAEKLSISPAYLNECVKKTTGLSVSNQIQSEIMLQAKRLLFYTSLNVKEIALQLGYEDFAYFTRLFTKGAKLSPTGFRKKYLKKENEKISSI